MHVWVVRAPGVGWATWRAHNDHQGWGAMGLGLGDLGLGDLGIGGHFTGPLAMAYHALNNPQIIQGLGISNQQAAQFKQQITDFAKTMIQDHANLLVQRVELQSLLAEKTPDESAVNSQLQKLGNAQMTLQKDAVDFVVKAKQEITPEQQQKIRQFLQERRQHFGMERRLRPESGRPPEPGSGTYVGSQPPNGAQAYQQNQQPQYWQNSQGEPEQSPAPQQYAPYNMGEPQGSTPMTSNQ
jgi:Spy/CpxP family protein refolding chaperone